MKYAKLINNSPSYAPNPILIDGMYIGNPPGFVYEDQGYKPVVYSDPPGEAPAGYQWQETWSENENIIQQGWVLEEVPISEDEALVRYANELTGKQDETLEGATETLLKLFKEDK
jgi:hypothetical protein